MYDSAEVKAFASKMAIRSYLIHQCDHGADGQQSRSCS
jgi:hypothetical protein